MVSGCFAPSRFLQDQPFASMRVPREDASSLRIEVQLIDDRALPYSAQLLPPDNGIQKLVISSVERVSVG